MQRNAHDNAHDQRLTPRMLQHFVELIDDAGLEIPAIDCAERYMVEIGCPKLMIMVRRDQPALDAYYDALGYQTNEVTVFGKRLIVDQTDPNH